MDERFHFATFAWGLVLTIAGAAITAVGFGWWEMASLNLAYLAPIVVILVGAVITFGALTTRSGPTDRSEHV
ncbi:MAG TPA: hypothetical protein VFS66_10915 [Acidimicrobiia bacterium]|nr:hypothetical protein [Acidimicrobiia bacterium]